MTLKSRSEFPALLKRLSLVGNAVEVGVAEGYNSFHILDHWPGRLYMVDPWAILKTDGFTGHGEDTQDGMDARYERILAAIRKYNPAGQQPRAVPMRMTSEQAVDEFDDGFFDWVYLDGNHIRPEIEKDLEIWFPKLRTGAVFSGHDDLDGIVHGVDYGVKSAVRAFADKYGLTVNSTQEHDYPSWWLIKK